MYEKGISVSLYLVNSITCSMYVWKFLRGKFQKKFVLCAWTGLYFIIQMLILDRIDWSYPLHGLIKVLADITCIVLLQMLLYHRELFKQLFVAVSFVVAKELMTYIVVVLNYGWHWIIGRFRIVLSKKITTMTEVEMWNNILSVAAGIVYVFLYALLMKGYLSAISRKFIRKDYSFRTREYAFLILPNVSTLCISLTLKMMIFSVGNGTSATMFDRLPATLFWVSLICLLLSGGNIASVILFQKLVRLGGEERKRAMLENQMVQMQRQIEELQDIYADMRGLRHDMKNHLQSIAAVVSKISGGAKEELDGYIGSMEATVRRLDFTYRTGNPITDVIIHQKKQEAERQKISFEADFLYPDKQQPDVYDMGIVLNNALENAIEAAGKCEGKKSICLRSYNKGNLFFIEVENDFSGEIVFPRETGLPLSSKEDGRLHGLGMENIQRCAKKYKGDIDVTICDSGEGKKFVLTVMMCFK